MNSQDCQRYPGVTMAQWVTRQWDPPDERVDLSRKDRRRGAYHAFVPDSVSPGLPTISEELRGDLEAATEALIRADERARHSGRFLHHLLIRSESIASSWIEGNRVTPKRLAIAEVLEHGPQVALDVVANVRATTRAIEGLAQPERTVGAEDITALQAVIEPSVPGLRRVQNWVGGPGNSPLRADFVPPPPEEVPALVEDLAQFITQTDGNPLVRAAVAHAQFETIHPYIDGNGRTGRALIHTVLKRSGLLKWTLIPISTVFAGRADDYIAGLTRYREGPEGVQAWLSSFCESVEIAAQQAVRLSDAVDELNESTLQRFFEFRSDRGRSPVWPRAGAVVLRVLQNLGAEPLLTISGVQQRYEVSRAAAHRALQELEEAGVLKRVKNHKGNLVCWTADQYLNLATLQFSGSAAYR